MREEGFVYFGEVDGDSLRELVKEIGGRVVWLAWDLGEIICKEGISEQLMDNGSAFNERCEARWKRIEEGKFQVWVLSDQQESFEPLRQVEGEWKTENFETYLVPLNAPQFNPPFPRYPVVNAERAKLRFRVFYKDGVATFISPREVLPYEEA